MQFIRSEKILVTGVCGQDGAYLAASLLLEGYHVTGLTRKLTRESTWRLDRLGITNLIDIRQLDITDQSSITELIRTENFVEIYNLSAQSSVAASWNSPVSTAVTNSLGTLYMIEAIRNFSPITKFFQASSSEMYGSVGEKSNSNLNIFNPTSPYGISKVFAHQMVINYREAYNLHFCCGILYGHESPLRSEAFVTKKITSGLVSIKLGSKDTLSLGNINVERDWGYAPEYVEGMKMITRHSTPDDFVLATGQTTSVKNFVNKAAEALEIQLEWQGSEINEIAIDRKTGDKVVQINPSYYRSSEVTSQCGSPEQAHQILGWKALTDVTGLAEIMIKADYDRLT